MFCLHEQVDQNTLINTLHTYETHASEGGTLHTKIYVLPTSTAETEESLRYCQIQKDEELCMMGKVDKNLLAKWDGKRQSEGTPKICST